jgi:hypothetical protein
MKLTVILLICAVGVGCAHTTANKCTVDANRIIDEVQEHRIVYGAAGQFATPLGQRPTAQLFDRDQEMISCIASDPANRSHYRQAMDLDDSVKVGRFMQYMLETEQMQDFGHWESERQSEAVSVASSK